MEEDVSTTSASVHVIDDDDSFRRSITRMLEAAGFLAAGYSCAGDFMLRYPRGGNACILLDITMPGPSGIDLMKAVVTRDWAPPVIFVTGRDDVITAIDVMKWGAFSYLLKPIAAEALLQTVRDALLLDEQRRAMRLDLDRLRERFETLTSDERRIFCGVLSHRLNKQLAADLGVCERTIKAQRARMLDKLQIRTVPELVRAAKMLQPTERGTAVEPAAWPWFDSRAGVLQSD